MKVLQIVPHIGEESSGPSYSVPGLCRGLAENGVETRLDFLGKVPERLKDEKYKAISYPQHDKLNLGWSPEMLKGLREACKSVDIIHDNSLWMMPNVYPAWAVKGTKCKLVVAPRGTLAAWSLKKGWLKKKVFGWLLQNQVLRRADMFHATSEKEYEEIRALGYKQPVAIVPIGMEVPENRLRLKVEVDDGSRSFCSIPAPEEIRTIASKPMGSLTVEERSVVVDCIESTDVIDIRQSTDARIQRFVKGYWDGDAKTIKEIVEWGKSIVPARVENRYIGEIQTHKNSIRSILFHTRFRGPLKVLVLERLDEILKNAVLFNKGKDGEETFFNLAHRLRFDLGDGREPKEFVARLIVKETADGNRTWTMEFSNKKELTGMPTTGEAATVEVTHLKSPSTHNILKQLYAVKRERLRQVVFLGRLHKVKAVDRLVQAWEIVTKESNHHCQPQPSTSTSFHDWELVIAGPDNGIRNELERYIAAHKIPRVRFVGEINGPAKYEFLSAADLYVLPSFTENFGVTVAEALACGTPVIVSKGTPWSGVEGEGRGNRSTVEFVNLEPGDTFDQIEQYLRDRVSVTFENKTLGISASIGSKRNANELAKHMAAGESPEAHKFAAKNIGALFERGVVGFTHLDKKATPDQRWITRFVRVLSVFVFGGERFVATLTLKAEQAGGRLYAVEAVEINQDVKLRSTPRGAISKDLNSAPILNLTSQLTNRIAYYVGDVKRTHPAFLGRSEPFSIERAVDLIRASLRHSQPQPSTSTLSRCGWWVDNDPETLAATLREAMALSDEGRRQMGENGKEWIRRDFSWEGVGAKMKAAYEWLLNPSGVVKPDYVRVLAG